MSMGVEPDIGHLDTLHPWEAPFPDASLLSSGFAIVIPEHAAKAIFMLKTALSPSNFITRFDNPVGKPLMVTLLVIMLVEFFQSPAEGVLSEEDHAIQTLRFE